MAIHRDRVVLVEEVSEWERALARLAAFMEVNGYEVSNEEPLEYERGKRGAGWWSSEMSALYARCQVRKDEDGGELSVALDVDTTGQHMTSEDLTFWREELEAMREHVLAADDVAPIDRREHERARAQDGRKETLRLSVYGFFITFALLFMLILVLQRMGMLRW